jgi:hypothetical protein
MNGEAVPSAKTGREIAILALVLILIGSFYTLTIRAGHFWGDDFAQYIHHAENIANHHPYADNGYVYNRFEPTYSPRTYPPVFPALLAPVVKLYGLNLEPMKVEEVLFFLTALVLIYFAFRRYLPFPYLLALIIILGLSPSFWDFKDLITSDFPFLALFYLGVILIRDSPRNASRWWLWALLTGAVLYCAYGVRTIGLMILPGFAIYELARYRKITRFFVASVAVCIMLILLQRVVFSTAEASYADQFRPTIALSVANIRQYTGEFVSLWPRTAGVALSYFLFLAVTLLAVIGARDRFRQGITPLEPILAFYLALIIIWPGNQGLRFVMPLIPVYFFYALTGLSILFLRFGKKAGVATTAALALLIAISYLGGYRHANFGSIPETTGLASFVDLCRYIDAYTDPQDVFVFNRARALSLFADRPATVYFFPGNPASESEQWRFFQSSRARYIVASNEFETDRNGLQPFLQRYAEYFEQVYKNTDFAMYRIRSFPPAN